MTLRLGLFDSGVGGFSVLEKILLRHGNISCLYLADTARVPYGERGRDEIRNIAQEIVTWLRDQDVAAVVVACNTTNSLAFDVVKKFARVPVIGLLGAGAEMVTAKRVGVLATPATAASNSYKKAIHSIRPDTFVIEEGCEEFVPLIEAGKLKTDELISAIDRHLIPLLEASVDEIVLGCSHYPLIKSSLMQFLSKDIRLIDPAEGLAIKLDKFLGQPQNPFNELVSLSNTRFCVTSNPNQFACMVHKWLGVSQQVEIVSLT